MSTSFHVSFTKISSGNTDSGVVGLGNGLLAGIWSPVVDSCQLFLKTSFDITSANFTRNIDTFLTNKSAESGYSKDWRWDVAQGSESITLTNPIAGFPYAKLESSVSQTDVRTFAVIVKF